jgi:hypothetical protein
MFANGPPRAAIVPESKPAVSGRCLASMLGASLVLLPLYAAGICWVAGLCEWNWRWAAGVALGTASITAGLGMLFAIGQRTDECTALGGQDTCLPR